MVSAQNNPAEALRHAIERLINAKLADALSPGGLDRLNANRRTGVACYDIRKATQLLDQEIEKVLKQKLA